jgi:hypothetical protein
VRVGPKDRLGRKKRESSTAGVEASHTLVRRPSNPLSVFARPRTYFDVFVSTVVDVLPPGPSFVVFVLVSSPQPTIMSVKHRVNSIAVSFFMDIVLNS